MDDSPSNGPLSLEGGGNQSPAVSPNCRARRIGVVKEFCECETADAAGCQYKIPFGHTMFCRHPRWPEIVAQTEAGN